MPDPVSARAADHPDEMVVRALALDLAIDARLRGGNRPGEPSPSDELTDLAAGLSSLPADWWDEGCLPDGRTPGTGGGAAVAPLRPVSLDRAAPSGLRASSTRPGKRRRRREALAATAAVAALFTLVEVGPAGGHHTSDSALTLPITTRLAMVDDRLQLAPTVPSSSGLSRLAAVSCPGADRCIGVADTSGSASVATSDDGGRTWIRRSAPFGVTRLTAVTCATLEHCWAVGNAGREGALLATTDGGDDWVRQSTPSGVVSLDAISCPTTTACWAVGTMDMGGAIVATIDGGGIWARQSAPAGVTSLDAVSCPTVTACWAGGGGPGGAALMSTHDGGGNWVQDVLPPAAGPGLATRVAAVVCPTVQTCWAADTGARGSVIALTGGATPWASTAAARGGSVAGTGWAPLCPSGCGGATDPASPVTERAVEGSAAGAVSGRTADGALTCPTVVQCWAVGAGTSGFTADAVDLG